MSDSQVLLEAQEKIMWKARNLKYRANTFKNKKKEKARKACRGKIKW